MFSAHSLRVGCATAFLAAGEALPAEDGYVMDSPLREPERAVRQRVASPAYELGDAEPALDEAGLVRAALGGPDAWRKQVQDGSRRLAAFSDDNFYGGAFAAHAPRTDTAAALPTAALPAQAGCEATPATAPRRRLCMCPLHCFHEVFGEEDFCDFCNAGAAWMADGECECVGENTGLDRPCCVGSDDDDPDDAGEGYTIDVPSDAARDVTPPRMHTCEGRHGLRRDAMERAFGGAAPSEQQEQPRDDPEPEGPVFTDASRIELVGGARRHVILDEHGAEIQWPWEGGRTEPPPAGTLADGGAVRDIVAEQHFAKAGPLLDELGSHGADATVQAGLNAATSDGKGGENSSGVRAYKTFCRKYGRAAVRPIDPNAPLWVKLSEERWMMRFIAETIDDRTILPATGRAYFGAANAWHLRKTGIGFAAGMDLKRLAEMVKGLKKLRDGPPRQLRRGISPEQLRRGMDLVFPPNSPENVNIRGMLATMLQGLMRGREVGRDGAWDSSKDLARGDIATLTEERFAFFMRPAKNMKHRRGKTVPIVIGGGGALIDACAEVRRMIELDPTPPGQEASTPMFRKPDGTAYTTDDIRAIVRQICFAINEDPLLFGAHSLRIGGATALFAAGAEPIHIRTMGRWSSDCYRLYVRACFEQTIAWTRKLGSQQVHDVQGTYERRAQETEEY